MGGKFWCQFGIQGFQGIVGGRRTQIGEHVGYTCKQRPGVLKSQDGVFKSRRLGDGRDGVYLSTVLPQCFFVCRLEMFASNFVKWKLVMRGVLRVYKRSFL